MPQRRPPRPRNLRLHFRAIVTCAALLLGLSVFTALHAAQADRIPAGPSSRRVPDTDSATNHDDAPKVSVQVNVVNVVATVRDKKGKVVRDLTKDDFILTEDGRPQDIHYFAKDTNLPLTLGLLVDTSLSQRRVLDQERNASRSFLDRMVREDKDKAFIIHFDREVELLQDLTSSHQKLEEALTSLRTPQLSESPTSNAPDAGPGQRRGDHGTGRQHGGTLLYDAVYLASDELMRKQSGRKALIILSDGVDRGSKETLEYAMETAQRADTIVYSILFKDDEAYEGRTSRVGLGIPGMGGPGMGGGGMGRRGGGRRYPPQDQESRPDGKKVLERISKETGGRLFEVSKKLPVDQIYSQIEEELRSQYNLGYTPSHAEGNAAGYHKIQLTPKKKDLIVEARDGYYSERTR
jgi:VWFA-related protein